MTDLRISTGIYVILNAAGLLLLRSAMQRLGNDGSFGPTDVLRPGLLAGVVAYGASFFVFIDTLRRHELSLVFPLYSGLAYGVAMLASWLLLHEAMSARKVLGLLAVGAGVLLLQR